MGAAGSPAAASHRPAAAPPLVRTFGLRQNIHALDSARVRTVSFIGCDMPFPPLPLRHQCVPSPRFSPERCTEALLCHTSNTEAAARLRARHSGRR